MRPAGYSMPDCSRYLALDIGSSITGSMPTGGWGMDNPMAATMKWGIARRAPDIFTLYIHRTYLSDIVIRISVYILPTHHAALAIQKNTAYYLTAASFLLLHLAPRVELAPRGIFSHPYFTYLLTCDTLDPLTWRQGMGKSSGGMAGIFGFDSAILILKAGGRVRRNGWGQNGNWLQLTTSNPSDHQVVASLQRSTSDGFTVPYTPTVLDLLSSDWTAEHIGDMLMIAGD